MKFDFLKSTRFWFLGLAAVVWALDRAGYLPSEVSAPLMLWALGSAGVRTFDRFGEKLSVKPE